MAEKKPKISRAQKKKNKQKLREFNIERNKHLPKFRARIARNFRVIKKYWKPIGIATLIYGILYFLFIRVLTAVDVGTLRDSIEVVFGDGEGSAATRVLTAASLFGAGASFDQQTAINFAIIWFVNSLAMIWIVRHAWAKKKISVREAYYQGMYPLVPVVLITLFVFVQAIPFSIALFIFQLAINNNLAIGLVERMGVLSLLVAGILISGYWIMGSIVALYSSTVPGIRPFQAIRTAAEILEGRRFVVLRQSLLFLSATGLFIVGALLLVIWIREDIAVIVTALLTILLLPWVHVYFYGLYRDLIDE